MITPTPLEKLTKTHFEKYVKVQEGSRYNMFTESRAAAASAGLSDDDYWGVLENYDALEKKFHKPTPKKG